MESSSQELVEELTYSWLEMHKKSALTYLVLRACANNSLWSKELEGWINEKTGWSIHDRALYRMLRRLEHQGLISHRRESALRTGADRKVYSITREGSAILKIMDKELRYLYVLQNES